MSVIETENLHESSAHGAGTINIILSDDETGMDFMDKVSVGKP